MGVEAEIRDIVEDQLGSIKMAMYYLLAYRKKEFEKTLQPLKCFRCSKAAGLDVFHDINTSIGQDSLIFTVSAVHRESGGVISKFHHYDPDSALKSMQDHLQSESGK
jgi:hypothetical protein